MKKNFLFFVLFLSILPFFSCVTTSVDELKPDECIVQGYFEYKYTVDGKNYITPISVLTINGRKVKVEPDGFFEFKGKMNTFYSITEARGFGNEFWVIFHDLNYYTDSKKGIMCDIQFSWDTTNPRSYLNQKIGCFRKDKFNDISNFGNVSVISKNVNMTKLGKFEKVAYKNPKAWMNEAVEKINAVSADDFEKVLYACRLIAENLSYDEKTYKKTKKFQSYRLNIDDAYKILRNKVGMCYEYAIVLKKFCDALEIPCIVASGFSKGDKPNLDWDKIKPGDYGNHAWNLVVIDGKKYYVDLCWADVSPFNYSWIFTDPVKFKKTHRSISPDN